MLEQRATVFNHERNQKQFNVYFNTRLSTTVPDI